MRNERQGKVSKFTQDKMKKHEGHENTTTNWRGEKDVVIDGWEEHEEVVLPSHSSYSIRTQRSSSHYRRQ